MKVVRLTEAQAQIGLSRSTIYLKIARGEFPRPISLGARAVGWLQSDLDQWIAERVAVTNEEGKS